VINGEAQAIVADAIEPRGFTGRKLGQVMTQVGHRIAEWHPLKPVLVDEVQYDHFTGGRFRHGAKAFDCQRAEDCICQTAAVLSAVEAGIGKPRLARSTGADMNVPRLDRSTRLPFFE
jgi:hypothetical protein